MKTLLSKKVLMALLLLITSTSAYLETTEKIQSPKVLRVGIAHYPPFSVINAKEYSGISVDIWHTLATHLGLKYKFVVMSNNIDQSVLDLSNDLIDVLVGPVTMTTDRSKKIEFAYPYAVNDIAIVVPVITTPFKEKLLRVIKGGFALSLLLSLLVFITYVHIIWYLERTKNSQLPETYFRGIAHIIWSRLLQKGIGMPITATAKIVELLWICVGTLFLSMVYASMFSIFHIYYDPVVTQTNPEVDKLCAIRGSIGYYYAQKSGYIVVPVSSLDEGLNMVLNHKVSGYSDSAATAFYYLRTHDLLTKLKVSPAILKKSTMNFGLPIGSPLMHQINEELSSMEENNIVLDICTFYLGKNKSLALCL